MTRPVPSQRYAIWLWLLLVLFALRVGAQPLALVVESEILPPFESWHSGALPYGVLLATQVVILVVFGSTAWRFTIGDVRPQRIIGRVALTFGGIYFALMLLRLVLGFTMLSDVRWFAASRLPTAFHLVLAAFVLLYGHFHFARAAGPLSVGTNEKK